MRRRIGRGDSVITSIKIAGFPREIRVIDGRTIEQWDNVQRELRQWGEKLRHNAWEMDRNRHPPGPIQAVARPARRAPVAPVVEEAPTPVPAENVCCDWEDVLFDDVSDLMVGELGIEENLEVDERVGLQSDTQQGKAEEQFSECEEESQSEDWLGELFRREELSGIEADGDPFPWF
jgi:hypothetical protein